MNLVYKAQPRKCNLSSQQFSVLDFIQICKLHVNFGQMGFRKIKNVKQDDECSHLKKKQLLPFNGLLFDYDFEWHKI